MFILTVERVQHGVICMESQLRMTLMSYALFNSRYLDLDPRYLDHQKSDSCVVCKRMAYFT